MPFNMLRIGNSLTFYNNCILSIFCIKGVDFLPNIPYMFMGA